MCLHDHNYQNTTIQVYVEDGIIFAVELRSCNILRVHDFKKKIVAFLNLATCFTFSKIVVGEICFSNLNLKSMFL